MVELAGASVGPFVEAAKALDIGLPQTQDIGDGSGAPAVVSPIVQAYVESIKDDAKALRTLSSGLLLQQKEAKLRRAVALVAEAHVNRTGSKAHVYTTGIGKSGLVAARLAASLRSISIRASHVPGNEWVGGWSRADGSHSKVWLPLTVSLHLRIHPQVHGDLGTLARDDVLICLSHSGRTTEMVDLLRRVRARGGHVLAITGDARSPLATIADVHLHAAVHTSEYLGAGICLRFVSISRRLMGISSVSHTRAHPCHYLPTESVHCINKTNNRQGPKPLHRRGGSDCERPRLRDGQRDGAERGELPR